MTKRILFQFDGDPQPSSFDSVVAVDSGVDHLFRYAGVQITNVTPLVHGAMFTRGGDDLRRTAIFVGGSDVRTAEAIFKSVQDAFFGPMRVSVMLDANGCNTTAAAAVVAAGRHLDLAGARAVVLGGTGPVGRRVAQMLLADGASVQLSSRNRDRATAACREIASNVPGGEIGPVVTETPQQTKSVVELAQIVIACGAAGVELIEQQAIESAGKLKVAIDLNAVPPAGIGGISVTDKAKPIGSAVAYGAIGVGGLKMKTHRAAIESMFERNDRVLDAAEIYAVAKSIG